jgi:hypothetical protein
MIDPLPHRRSSSNAFYTAAGPNDFVANPPTIGPWNDALQHGGPPAALLGRALEALDGAPGSRIARIAFDFFGPVPVAAVSIATETLRAGTKIRLTSATMRAGDRVVLRATAWHVLTEAGRSPAIPSKFVVPALPADEAEARFPRMGRFPYGDALEWRFVRGGYADLGPAIVWTRCRIPLIDGEPLTGLQRVLIMVDSANGVSAVLPFAEWTFVPVDLLIVMERTPDAEWVGMAAETTIGTEGVGITDTTLFDERGAFGRALQTLYVAPR